MSDSEREHLGRLVRDTWTAWANEQSNPKPSWLVEWADLDAEQREADMRIGEAVAAAVAPLDRDAYVRRLEARAASAESQARNDSENLRVVLGQLEAARAKIGRLEAAIEASRGELAP